MGIAEVKKDVAAALERLGLTSFVSLEEIERELRGVETMFQSLLLLGIMRRILDRKDNKAAELFIPAVTNWKNYLPHKALAGLTPYEYREKYPPGIYETRIIAVLLDEYQATLTAKTDRGSEPPDIESDFAAFQTEYFNRVPLEQPFAGEKGKLLTLKEIIREERRRANHPPDKIDEIGAKLFAENTAEGLGNKAAELDDAYYNALNELVIMQREPRRRSRARVRQLRELFERHESYHRAGPAPHQFYLNYAMTVFLDEDTDGALTLLDAALKHKPDYALARQMKKRFSNSRE